MVDFHFRNSGEYIDASFEVTFTGAEEDLGLLNKEEAEALLENLITATEDLVHLLHGKWIDIKPLIENKEASCD